MAGSLLPRQRDTVSPGQVAEPTGYSTHNAAPDRPSGLWFGSHSTQAIPRPGDDHRLEADPGGFYA